MMMFQMRPPLSLITKKPASQPAMAPKSNVRRMFMVLVLIVSDVVKTKIEIILQETSGMLSQYA
jgi:hypothetical protein